MNYQCYITFHLKESIYALRYFWRLYRTELCPCAPPVSPREVKSSGISMIHFAPGNSVLVQTISYIVPCSCDSHVMPQTCWSRWQNNMVGFWLTDPKTKTSNVDIQNTGKCYEDHSALLLKFFCVILWNTDSSHTTGWCGKINSWNG